MFESLLGPDPSRCPSARDTPRRDAAGNPGPRPPRTPIRPPAGPRPPTVGRDGRRAGHGPARRLGKICPSRTRPVSEPDTARRGGSERHAAGCDGCVPSPGHGPARRPDKTARPAIARRTPLDKLAAQPHNHTMVAFGPGPGRMPDLTIARRPRPDKTVIRPYDGYTTMRWLPCRTAGTRGWLRLHETARLGGHPTIRWFESLLWMVAAP